MKKTISIIIPTYNRAHHLKTLLTQLTNQSRIPDEIIIIDDHSSDSTPQVVKQFIKHNHRIRYYINQGRYQRDGKKTGLTQATGDYISFLDDDILIEDVNFLANLEPHLNKKTVVQAKVILENMGKTNIQQESFIDHLTVRPYPILELVSANLNVGSKPRPIYPIIEFGNFWPGHLRDYFIDNNLINDAYGESYASAIKLYRAGITIHLIPELVIRHPGAASGGSNRFDKKHMLKGFSNFHAGYFYNMIYIHARYWPWWIWLWLPFFISKALVALAFNHDFKGLYHNAIKPSVKSLKRHFIYRQYAA